MIATHTGVSCVMQQIVTAGNPQLQHITTHLSKSSAAQAGAAGRLHDATVKWH